MDSLTVSEVLRDCDTCTSSAQDRSQRSGVHMDCMIGELESDESDPPILRTLRTNKLLDREY